MTTKIVVYYPDLTVEYSGKDIIRNYIRGSQITSDNSIISFGVNSQYGNCCLYDTNGVVMGKILDETISSDSLISVFVYLDTKKIGEYFAEITYSFVDNFIELELHDSLYKWGKIKYSGFTVADIYDNTIIGPHTNSTINGYQLYSKLRYDTDYIGAEGASFFKPLSTDIQNYLSTIVLEVPYIECEYLMESWNYFCELVQGAIFKNEDGFIEVLIYE